MNSHLLIGTEPAKYRLRQPEEVWVVPFYMVLTVTPPVAPFYLHSIHAKNRSGCVKLWLALTTIKTIFAPM